MANKKKKNHDSTPVQEVQNKQNTEIVNAEETVKQEPEQESEPKNSVSETAEFQEKEEKKTQGTQFQEIYRDLQAQLAVLKEETGQMQAELQKLTDRRGNLNRRLYKEFLDSEILCEVTEIYLGAAGKKELYGQLTEHFQGHEEECGGIRAELRAMKEYRQGENVSSLACATGILSVAGLVYAASGIRGGAVILLFAVLTVISALIYAYSEKNKKICGCAEYLLSVLEDSGKDKKL